MATIKIKQIKSKIGYPIDQKRTLQALGLHKISQVVEVEDCPSIRGMIRKLVVVLVLVLVALLPVVTRVLRHALATRRRLVLKVVRCPFSAVSRSLDSRTSTIRSISQSTCQRCRRWPRKRVLPRLALPNSKRQASSTARNS